MKNYKLIISYDGTRYYGWEHQPDKDTVQGRLENVLSRMCGVSPGEIKINGAGRTDAGVHAKGMVASVFLETGMSADEIMDYANHYLPDDIVITQAREASERFHARYNAVGKTYRYTCHYGRIKPVFDRKYVTRLDFVPDVEKMRQAAKVLVGKHDFKSFCSNPRMKKSTIRIVDKIEISTKNGYLYFNVHGTGFLQNMVRIIVGTLLEVGKGAIEPERVEQILEAKDRKLAGPTAPPEGLCLIEVDYQ